MLKAILIVLAMTATASLVPLIMWRLAGERRVRHIDGPKGYLRDTVLSYALYLQVPVMIGVGAVWAALDASNNAALPAILIVASGLLSTNSEAVPPVKRARNRLELARLPENVPLYAGVQP